MQKQWIETDYMLKPGWVPFIWQRLGEDRVRKGFFNARRLPDGPFPKKAAFIVFRELDEDCDDDVPPNGIPMAVIRKASVPLEVIEDAVGKHLIPMLGQSMTVH